MLSMTVLLGVKMGGKGRDPAGRLLQKSRYETGLVAMRSKGRREFKESVYHGND